MKKYHFFAGLFICYLTLVSSMVSAAGLQAVFKPFLKFSCGSGNNQLLWLVEDNGGVLDGPFQGPMAFLTDKNGNLWAGDSLNARVVAFDKTGRPGKEIDLIVAAKAAGLATDPVLLDFVPGRDARLLVADAANNAIISIDIRGGQARAYLPASQGSNGWSQINRVHTDGAGRIYIEDIATMKTVVLQADGKAFCDPLDGEVGLAVAADGKIAMVVNDSLSPDRRQIVLAPAPGEPFVHIAGLKAGEPILWANAVGFDAQNRLVVVFDTVSQRSFVTFDTAGKQLNHRTTEIPEPGYDPVRPEWVGSDGEVYSVKIGTSLEILRLE